MNKFEAVVHQAYLCMKMSGPNGVISVFVHQQITRDIERGVAPGEKNVHHLENTKVGELKKHFPKLIRAELAEKTKRVPLDPNEPDKCVTIGAELAEEEEAKLMNFLRENKSVFAWSTTDLQGVSRKIIEHQLNIDMKVKPKKQKLEILRR